MGRCGASAADFRRGPSGVTPTHAHLGRPNRTAAAPRLLAEVTRRSKAGPCEFTLLVPDVHDRKAADWTLETAVPLLRRAARGPVEGLVGGANAVSSVRDAVSNGNFDEIIISTLPSGVSKWLRRDLVSQTERMGLPVTAIIPGGGLSNKEAAKQLAELGPTV